MRVLVTGINGFIGAQTARKCLEAGWEVVGLIRSTSDMTRVEEIRDQVDWVYGDLSDIPAVIEQAAPRKPDLCIHHAWYAEPGKYPHAIENLESLNGTLELVSKLPQAGCHRFVGIGTCFEYDFDRGWLREDSPCVPATLYAACKNSAAVALPKLAEKVEVQSTWVRLFYQYGPFEDHRRLVSSVIRSLLAGQTVDTTEGGQVRDFLHVEDVGAGIYEVARAGLTGIVNVGSGQPVTVRRIVETISRNLGREDLVNFGARPYNPTDPPFVVANNGRLRSETGWVQRWSLDEGLVQTIDWWRNQA